MPKPVIFIPGYPASKLVDPNTKATLFPPSIGDLADPAKKAALLQRLTTDLTDVVAGEPIEDKIKHFAPAASTLYAILRDAEFGYDTDDPAQFVKFGWDWRRGIGDPVTMTALRTALDSLSPNKNGNVVAIVHSTGGLVLRALLEQSPEYAKCFDQVLAFAVPWCGALEALRAISLGVEIVIGFPPVAVTLLSTDEGKNVMSRAQAAYDLLPTDATANLFIAGGVATTPLAQRDWMDRPWMSGFGDKAHGQFPRVLDDIDITCVCGWGGDTYPICTDVGGHLTFPPAINDAGDGTVPFVSSSWLQGNRVRSQFLPIGAFGESQLPEVHGQIWEPPAVRQIFREVLNGAPRRPFIAAAADKDQYIDTNSDVVVRVGAADSDGKPLPEATATLNFSGPKQTFSFNGGKRLDITITKAQRSGVHANVGHDNYRFTVDVNWKNAPAPVTTVLLIKST
jgi:pimeloyl-ACP methyl ester carboxylesterase